MIVAGGDVLNAMWQTFPSYDSPDPMGRRGLFFRTSRNAGKTWGRIYDFSFMSTGDPPGEPMGVGSIAMAPFTYFTRASGTTGVFEVSTFSCSHGGCAGVGEYIGGTTNHGPEGLVAHEAIAVSGNKLAVAWVADDLGTIKARFSPDDVGTFGPEVTIANSSRTTKTGIDIAMKGGRTVIAWSTGSAIKLRSLDDGVLGPVRMVATFSEGGTFKSGYLPAVQLVGSEGVGVSWSECRRANCTAADASPDGVDLAWSESTDSGVTWSPRTALANSMSSVDRRRNEAPSIVWSGGETTRSVLFSTSSANHQEQQVYLRRGTGTP